MSSLLDPTFFLPAYLLSILLVGALSKSSFITPYIAGGVGLFLASAYNLNFLPAVFVVVSLYLTASLAAAIPESRCEGLDTSLILNEPVKVQANPLACFALKAGAVLLFAILPIPKPGAYITGWVGFALIAGLVYANSSRPALSRSLVVISSQTAILALAGALTYFYSDAVNPIFGIIAAVAIPKFLFPYKGRRREYVSSYGINTVGVTQLQIMFSLLAVWLTPGFSTSAVATSFFYPGVNRQLAIVGLEGATEGYVLNLILRSQQSSKTPLGILLSLPYTNWGSFTVSQGLHFTILAAVLLSIVFAAVSPLTPMTSTPATSAAIVMCQAVVALGTWAWVYLIAGCLCLLIRRTLTPEEEDSVSLALLVPMLFF